MKLGLIAAPVVASYLPIVPKLGYTTKMLLPDTASVEGLVRPAMKLGLIAAPVVALYSPIVPPAPATKRILPDTASATGFPMALSGGNTMKLGLIAAPVVALYPPPEPLLLLPSNSATKRLFPDTAIPSG